MKPEAEKLLHEQYYNPKSAASYTNPKKLWKQVQKNSKTSIKSKELKEWIGKQTTYSLHRQAIHRFPRKAIIPTRFHGEFDLDLADLSKLHRSNDRVKYLAVFICLFSRQLFVEVLTDKRAETMLTALKNFLAKIPTKPRTIRTDMGE